MFTDRFYGSKLFPASKSFNVNESATEAICSIQPGNLYNHPPHAMQILMQSGVHFNRYGYNKYTACVSDAIAELPPIGTDLMPRLEPSDDPDV